METASKDRGRKNRPVEESRQSHYPTEQIWYQWRQEWALAVNRHKFSKGDKHAKAVGMVLAFRAWSKSENGHQVGTYTFGNEELALLAGIAGKDVKASRDAVSKALRTLADAEFIHVSSRGSNAHGLNSTVQLLFPESARSLRVVRGAGESDQPDDEVRVSLAGESNQPGAGEFNQPMAGESNQPGAGEFNQPSTWKSVNESENNYRNGSDADDGDTVTVVDEDAPIFDEVYVNSLTEPPHEDEPEPEWDGEPEPSAAAPTSLPSMDEAMEADTEYVAQFAEIRERMKRSQHSFSAVSD